MKKSFSSIVSMKLPNGKKLALLNILIIGLFIWFWLTYGLFFQMGSHTTSGGYMHYAPFTIGLRKVKEKLHLQDYYTSETFFHAKLNRWEERKWIDFLEKFPEEEFSYQGLYNHLLGIVDPSLESHDEVSESIKEVIKNTDMKKEEDGLVIERYLYDTSVPSPDVIYHLQVYNDGKDLYFRYIN